MSHFIEPEIEAWCQLVKSSTVREQQMAFTCATGVPLTLAPASEHALADGTFCVKGCLGEHSGELCQQKLLQAERRAVSALEPLLLEPPEQPPEPLPPLLR